MKKGRVLVVLILALAVIAGGCSAPAQPAADEPAAADTGAQAVQETKTPVPTEDPAEAAAEQARIEAELAEQAAAEAQAAKEERGKALKVLFLAPGMIDHEPAFMAAYLGLQQIEQDYGSTIAFWEMGDDQGSWESAMAQALQEDWDIILTFYAMAEIVNRTAPEYPDKRFIVVNGSGNMPPENVFEINYRLYEAAFLAGALAAGVTRSDMALANEQLHVGAIGGFSFPVVNILIAGYVEGVQYVDDSIGVTVTYADNFGDPQLGETLAAKQYTDGVDVIYNVAGATGNGIFNAALAADKYAIGVDVDQALMLKDEFPEKAAHILTSVVRKFGEAVYWAIDQHLSETLKYGSLAQSVGLAEGAVGIVKNQFYDVVDPQIREMIEDIEAGIISGEIALQVSLAMSNEELEQLIADAG